MKIYKHYGPGLAVGSEVIVLARNKVQAMGMIRENLDAMGLTDEKLCIDNGDTEEFKEEPQILYSWNGEY